MRTDLQKLSNVYKLMLDRCYNPKMTGYHDYGGRGIYVCDEWLDNPGSFFDFAFANKDENEDLQLDRIDVDGPYSPENCRFVTRTVNMRNRRNTRLYNAFGQSKTLAEWAEDDRVVEKNWRTIRRRIDLGYTVEEAFGTGFSSLKEARKILSARRNQPTIEAFGESKTLAEWAEDSRCVVSKQLIFDRMKRGWDAERAIATPARPIKNKACYTVDEL